MIGTSKNIWGFDPRSVPGCVVWLDAADSNTLTLSGSNITAWRDKSVLGNNVTSISATPPTFSSVDSSVNFTSASCNFLRGNLSDTYSNNATVFAVASITPTPELSAGVVTTFAGNGTGSYVNGTGTNATFQFPSGVTVNGSGTIYISDTWNHRIRLITPSGVVSLLAGSGTPAFGDGTGAGASFSYPAQIAVDINGNAYVADTNNQRIRRITLAGVVTTFAGNGTASSVDGTGGSATLNTPVGLTISKDNTLLFVTEANGNRVRQIVISTAVVTTVAGNGTSGATNGVGTNATFGFPIGVAPDPFGNLYVLDPVSHRIRKIEIATRVVSTFAGSSLGTANGIGTNAQFNYPSGVTCDENGNVYIAEADTPRIRKITPDGVVTTFAGSGTATSVDGTGTNATFSKPRGMFYYTDGFIYVVDEVGHRIRRMNTKTVNLTFPQVSSLGSNAATENNLMGQAFEMQGVTPNLLTFVENSSNPTGLGSNIQTYLSNNLLNKPLILANTSTYSGTTFGITSLLNGTTQTFTSRTGTLATNSSNVSTYNKYAIGGMLNVTATVPTSFNGKVFEYLVFNNALTTAQRQQIEGYLGSKWGLSGYYSPILPLSIPGCQLWLDAADSSTITLATDSNVSIWRDKSGLGNNLSNTGSTFATRTTTPGLFPSIFVNGSACQLTSVSNNTLTGNSSRTVFMVAQVNAGGNSRFGTGSNASATPPSAFGFELNLPAALIFSPYVYTASDITFSSPNSNMYCLYADYNSATSTLTGIINFSTTTTKSTTLNTTATPWYLGLRPTDGGFSTSAHVCEIIAYNTSLTVSQRQQVEGYLGDKWGLRRLFIPTSPLLVPGCVMWLDGSDQSSMTLSGSSVTQWVDKSGSGNTCSNATISNCPVLTQNILNGLSVLSFTGPGVLNTTTSQWLDNTTMSFPNVSNTIFAVVYNSNSTTKSATGNNYIISGRGDARISYSSYTSNLFATFIGNGSTWNTVGTNTPGRNMNGVWSLTGMTLANNVLTPYFNRVAQDTKSGTMTAMTGLIIGDAPSGFRGQCLNGYIAEILIYNVVLTTDQRQSIETYLVNKWGLLGLTTINPRLIITHPYYSLKPHLRQFQPSDIEGCQLWLDAADSSTLTLQAGNRVSAWVDKSSNAFVMSNATTLTQPTYVTSGWNGSYPGVQVNGAGSGQHNFLSNAAFNGFNTAAWDIYAVIKHSVGSTTAANYGALMWIDPSGSFIIIAAGIGGASYATLSNGGWQHAPLPGSVTTQSPYLYQEYSTGTAFGRRLNGVQPGLSEQIRAFTGVARTGTYPFFLANPSGGWATCTTHFGEMLMFNRTLLDTERLQIEGYLSTKWGLTQTSFSSTAFNPTSITGCQLWFDASDTASLTPSSITTGTNVSQWNDKSGNNRHMSNGNTANQPRYSTSNFNGSLPSVYFRGITELGSTNASILSNASSTVFNSTTWDIYVAFKPAGGQEAIFWNDPSGAVVVICGNTKLGGDGGQNFATHYAGWRLSPLEGACRGNECQIYQAYSTGTTLGRRVNGGFEGFMPQTASYSWPSRSSNSELSFCRPSGGGWSEGNLAIAEVIVYNTVLSDANRSNVESYLTNKWRIGRGLQLGHPYYSFPSASIPFSLSNIPGVQLWLDAADESTLSLSNSTVTQWRDKSSNARHTTTIGGSPTYNSNSKVINLNGSSTYLVGPYNNTTAFLTMFAVSTVNFSQGGAGSYRLVSVGSTLSNDFNNVGSASILRVAGASQLRSLRVGANNLIPVGTITSDVRFLIMAQYNGTTSTNFVNGSNIASLASTSNFNISSYSIGRDVGNTAGTYTYWPGTVSEVIIFSSVLSTLQRQQVEGYLAQKWGLTGSLPSSHPFRKIPTSPFQTPILETALSYLPLATDSTDIGTNRQIVTTNGTVTYTTIGGRQCAYFNNSTANFLSLPYVNQTVFTICFWFRPIDGTYYTVASITTAANSPALQVDTDTATSIRIYTAMPNQWSIQPAATTLGAGNWSHVAITVNQSTFVVQVYVNGIFGSSATGTGTGISSRNLFYLGKSGDNGRAFNGYINKFAFFNKVLSAQEISEVFIS